MENGKWKIIGAASAELCLHELCRVVTIIAEGNGKLSEQRGQSYACISYAELTNEREQSMLA